VKFEKLFNAGYPFKFNPLFVEMTIYVFPEQMAYMSIDKIERSKQREGNFDF